MDDRTLVASDRPPGAGDPGAGGTGDRTLIAAGERAQVMAGERTQVVAAGARCPVCETANAPGEIWCGECGFRLDATPGETPSADRLTPPAHLRDEGGAAFPIRPGLNGIGRVDSAILLADPTVSRQHARIGLEDGRLWIEDVGSSNGTLVDGARLSPGQRRDLQGGEKLQFGSKVLHLEIDRRDLLGTAGEAVPAGGTAPGAGAAPSEATAPSEAAALSGEAPAAEGFAAAEAPAGKAVAGVEAPAGEAVIEEAPDRAEAPAGEGVLPDEASPQADAGAAGDVAAGVEEDEPHLILSSGERFPLREGVTTIGRRGDNDLVIADAYTSGAHAQIIRDGVALFLFDTGSTNGTLLNGQRLTPGERAPMRDGDAIVFGRVEATYHGPEMTG